VAMWTESKRQPWRRGFKRRMDFKHPRLASRVGAVNLGR
jgi:hypothetical protein